MTEKQCNNCIEFSFNKCSPSNFEDRHYCNLALRNGIFDDKYCLRFPSETCKEWKGGM